MSSKQLVLTIMKLRQDVKNGCKSDTNNNRVLLSWKVAKDMK